MFGRSLAEAQVALGRRGVLLEGCSAFFGEVGLGWRVLGWSWQGAGRVSMGIQLDLPSLGCR